jgi:hypothetical protein
MNRINGKRLEVGYVETDSSLKTQLGLSIGKVAFMVLQSWSSSQSMLHTYEQVCRHW